MPGGDLVYQTAQFLIGVWDDVREAMERQNVDSLELSFRTEIEQRELDDYLENFADIKVGKLYKIVKALNLDLQINVGPPL